MRAPVVALTASAAALAAFAPRAALADDSPVFEVVGKAGYASGVNTLGLGGRLGYAYRGLYGGLSFVDFFPLGTLAANAVVAEAEVGYGFTIAFVTIRPLLGVGFGFSDGPECQLAPVGQPVPCGSNGTFVLQPGGLVQLGFGHLIFGVDASAFIPFGTGSEVVLEVDGQVGARF